MKKLILFILLLLCSSLYSTHEQEKPPLTIVIFGATGDLSAKKLFPAFYNLSMEEDALNKNFSIVGIGRRDLNNEEFQSSVYQSLQTFSRIKPSHESWDAFKSHLIYLKADFNSESDYLKLKNLLVELDQITKKPGNYLFYLATDCSYFPIIIDHLHKQGLLDQMHASPFARVIIEKPFGTDLPTAIELQQFISQFLHEDQIFRMDHYLGKAGVQKLTEFRLQNTELSSLFNQQYVSNIQITLSETIGIGTRANFYEETGHLRDVIQNHAMQLFALATMEMPLNNSCDEIIKSKAQVLNSILPFPDAEIDQFVIRGQYTSGEIQGTAVLGYRDEDKVPKTSQVETFVQTKMFIGNEQWQGVPIYIKSGKRLPEQLTQITFQFKENPLQITEITISIQPHSHIYITKKSSKELYEVKVDPAFARREGYENLILAAIQGDQSHFVTIDELIATWKLLTPVLNHWKNSSLDENMLYPAGQWGPKSGDEQLLREGFKWTHY